MNEKNLKKIINVLSLLSMLAGGLGMLYCFQFFWSSKMNDLIGAGLPFVAGSILFGAGLITFGLFNKKE